MMGLSRLFADNFSCLFTYMSRKATILWLSTKIEIIMSNNVNRILLRPVPGIVLALDSVLLKMEQLMSWLQSGWGGGALQGSAFCSVPLGPKDQYLADLEYLVLLYMALLLSKPALFHDVPIAFLSDH